MQAPVGSTRLKWTARRPGRRGRRPGGNPPHGRTWPARTVTAGSVPARSIPTGTTAPTRSATVRRSLVRGRRLLDGPHVARSPRRLSRRGGPRARSGRDRRPTPTRWPRLPHGWRSRAMGPPPRSAAPDALRVSQRQGRAPPGPNHAEARADGPDPGVDPERRQPPWPTSYGPPTAVHCSAPTTATSPSSSPWLERDAHPAGGRMRSLAESPVGADRR